jgi:hypothetical protein
MTDERNRSSADTDDALDRIEEARSEAAAYVVQRQPLEPASAESIRQPEARIVDAVDEAQTESDPDELQALADQAEAGRDEIRRQMYGPGSEPEPEGSD